MIQCVCGKSFKRSKNAEKHFIQCRIKCLMDEIAILKEKLEPPPPPTPLKTAIKSDTSWIKSS